MADDCIFCKIVAGQIPAAVVYSDDDVFAFRDINPAAPKHVIVIPRKHIPSLVDAGPEDASLLGKMYLGANAVAKKEGLHDGFRCVLNCGRNAGQEVPHIHMHILGGRPLSWPPG